MQTGQYVVKEVSKIILLILNLHILQDYAEYYNPWNLNAAELLEKKIKELPCKFLYSMWADNKS